MLLVLLFLYHACADVVYHIQTEQTCTSSSSGSSITSKTMCETQATALSLADTTAISIAMSTTIPTGCIYKDGQLYFYDSQNSNQCSDTFQCICKHEAPVCSVGVNQHDCVCGNEICTNDNGLVCSGSTCSHPPDCTVENDQICKCGTTDCTPTTGLQCSGSTCSHTPNCYNKNGLVPNDATCQCGLFDCVEKYCVAASSTCHAACASGTYVNNNFQCASCDIPGYYCPHGATQSATSFPCPMGTYSEITPIDSAVNCLKCPQGRHSDRTGVSNAGGCSVCSSNTYQDEPGQRKCKGCPDEKIIIDTITESKHDSLDDCVINIPTCPSVQFLENNICKDCTKGSVCDGTSNATCPVGHYCTGDGSKTPCPAGKYGETTGNTELSSACIDCTSGSFQTLSGQSFCDRTCPIGTYGTVQGATSVQDACLDCPTGHMCPTISMQFPVTCPQGTFQPNVRSSSCTQCPQNSYASALGSTSCTKCVEPLQTSGIGSTSISECVEISKSCTGAQRPVDDICTDCEPGFYSNGIGCSLCPIGYSQPIPKQTECHPCENCHLLGTSTTSDTFEFVSNVTIYDTQSVETQSWGNYIVYLALGASVLLFVAIHRCCPTSLKYLDLFFSGEHPIEDTHARRVLETRLGAVLSLSIPLIVAGISVFVFTDDNTSVNTSLVPVDTVRIERDFNHLYFEYRSFYANGVSSCDNMTMSTKMSCEDDITSFESSCLVNISCFVDKDISGNNLIELKVPDNQQWAVLTSFSTKWMNTQKKINTVLKSDTPLSGTHLNPTIITLGLTRSKFHDIPSNTSSYGIKMNFRDVQITDNSDTNGFHHVVFKLTTSESVFSYITDVKLSFITQLSTVLTLLISVLSSMKIIKLGLEQCIDTCYTTCCDTVPQDVQRRKEILEEHKATPNVEVNNIVMQEIHTDEHGRKYYYNAKKRISEWVL